jgi:3-oxocholest-4-en-26-oate---CoA ligase
MAPNIADLFEHAADAVPERLAIACGDNEISYAGLEAGSNQLAHLLAASGVRAGDKVGARRYAAEQLAVRTDLQSA